MNSRTNFAFVFSIYFLFIANFAQKPSINRVKKWFFEMPRIRSILILLQIFRQCFGVNDLFNEAQKIGEQKRVKYEKLYEDFHIEPNSFDSHVNQEVSPTSPETDKAFDLLIYQNLLLAKGVCHQEGQDQCINSNGRNIPNQDKCQSLNGTCSKIQKYYSVGGYCNNLKNPNYGKMGTTFKQFLEAPFSDGLGQFETSTATSNKTLPEIREIGNKIDSTREFKFSNEEDAGQINNLASLMLGQLITHDVSRKEIYAVKGASSPGIRCCTQNYDGPVEPENINPNCVPTPVPKNDSFYADVGVRCFNFIRMNPTLDTHCKIVFQQKNGISSFLDLSNIYGDTDLTFNSLRTFANGSLKMDPSNILPNNSGNFVAGDDRVNQSPQLTLMHSLFYRLHNLLVQLLCQVNPHWDDERLFYEGRRINIAIYQNIVYNEWLPHYIGKQLCEDKKLICGKETNPCDQYDERIDPSTLLEFTNGAFRSYHRFLPPTVTFVNAAGEKVDEKTLSDTLLNIDILRAQYDDLLRGLLTQRINDLRPGYTDEIRNLMFKVDYKGKKVGSDLFTIDLSRSRDCRTSPYISYFPLCLSKNITCWDDLSPHFDENHLELLKIVYEDVGDVDLLVGILLENHRKNEIGEIGGCIIAEQFYRFRYGDRFFYSNSHSPNKLTKAQLNEISKMTFAKLICLVSGFEKVPRKGMSAPSSDNDYVECKNIKSFNTNVFME